VTAVAATAFDLPSQAAESDPEEGFLERLVDRVGGRAGAALVLRALAAFPAAYQHQIHPPRAQETRRENAHIRREYRSI
jgi:hypothetical protein